MKFNQIPEFPRANYTVTVHLKNLKFHLESWNYPDQPLIMEPEWQRGRIWTEQQKTSYMEYFLMGGRTGRDVYFNCSSWQTLKEPTPIYCLDGLQRINAALDFLDDKVPVFGLKFSEFEGPLPNGKFEMSFHMLNLQTKHDLLNTYINFNSGGTPHSPEEISRIKTILANTNPTELI